MTDAYQTNLSAEDHELRLVYSKYATHQNNNGDLIMTYDDFIEGYLGLYKKHNNRNYSQSTGPKNSLRPSGSLTTNLSKSAIVKKEQAKQEIEISVESSDEKSAKDGGQAPEAADSPTPDSATSKAGNESAPVSTAARNLAEALKVQQQLYGTENSQKSESMNKETLTRFARLVDTSSAGYISYFDFKAFENFLKHPDVLFRMAFRLYDQQNDGYIDFKKFKEVTESTILFKSYGFNWNSEIITETFGKQQNNKLTYNEFTSFINDFNYEMSKQQFLKIAEKNGNGTVSAHQFMEIMINLRPQRLSPWVKDNLIEFANQEGMGRMSFETFKSFNTLLDNVELAKKIIDKMERTGGDYKRDKLGNFSCSDSQFLQEALRSSSMTPMEVRLLFNFVKLIHQKETAVEGNSYGPCMLKKADLYKIAPCEEGMLPLNIAEVNQEKSPELIKKEQDMSSKAFEAVYRFLLGTLSGMAGALAIYPIDLVKTRMQNQKTSGNFAGDSTMLYRNEWQCFKHVLKYDGVRGLYRGLLPQMVGVGPEKALKLTVNDLVRDLLRKDGEVSTISAIIAGSCAGASQVIVTNPLEIVKIRLQMASEGAKAGAPKLGAGQVIKELGFLGLYKGASACFLRDIPFSFIYFPTYSFSKNFLLSRQIMVNEDGTLSGGALMGAGMFAGMPSAYFTTPADVIKTRLQSKGKDGVVYNGMRDCAAKILKDEGISAFFKGGLMRVFRSSPQFGVTLWAYEQLQRLCGPYADEYMTRTSIPIGSHQTIHSIHISQLPPLKPDHIGGMKMAAASYAGMENKFGLHLPR